MVLHTVKEKAADVNGDGNVDAIDFAFMRSKLFRFTRQVSSGK